MNPESFELSFCKLTCLPNNSFLLKLQNLHVMPLLKLKCSVLLVLYSKLNSFHYEMNSITV